MKLVLYVCFSLLGVASCYNCPKWQTYGNPPPTSCTKPTDPQKRHKSKIESWFTEEIFNDLFPKANLGWGPVKCRPYNYESFIIAARYFPNFGNEYVTKNPTGGKLNTNYSQHETFRRDLAAFSAHSIQETGENDAHLYKLLNKTQAGNCFYRGGMFNWFEGGPKSSIVKNNGTYPTDGSYCTFNGQYCDKGSNNSWWYPCASGKDKSWYKGCYFGRGSIQLSYNYNYGLFARWLNKQGIKHEGKDIDILAYPNLLTTKTDPPLIIMASLWFYMTPQSPKPAMHDIVIGYWVSPDPDYAGAVFGPTSLVINNECNGEDPTDPGGAGESRRIKAFRWFTNYFKVRLCTGNQKTLSCKKFNNGSKKFNFPDGRRVANSWDVNWKTSYDPTRPCQCVMQIYQGYIPAYDPNLMPQFAEQNAANQIWCGKIYQEGYDKQGCSKYKPIQVIP